MTNQRYKRQVSLMLKVFPEVAKETCFALHGGTAINLFVRDMPRVSVDIDLTYLPIEDRETSLENIAAALNRIKGRIEKVLPYVRMQHRHDVGKLLISMQGTDIKLEVNLVGRGTLASPKKMTLCAKAQNEFESFSAIPVVSIGQLYGGKICAALDRQHPRDLFDVKRLIENEGFTEEIKTGFLLCLLGGERPLHETIRPNLLDQRLTMANQFEGMSAQPFSYDDFEVTRNSLIDEISRSLSAQDKEFLLGFKNLEPRWDIYDFERFPAVQWKLKNLRALKETNPKKHQTQYLALKGKLLE